MGIENKETRIPDFVYVQIHLAVIYRVPGSADWSHFSLFIVWKKVVVKMNEVIISPARIAELSRRLGIPESTIKNVIATENASHFPPKL